MASDLSDFTDDGVDVSSSNSDFGIQELENISQTAIEPYMFEPEADLNDGESDSECQACPQRANRDNRLLTTDWCTCSNCDHMNSATESVCCKEIENMRATMADVEPEVDCICNHPGFATVCLDKWVLDTAYYQYRQQYNEKITDTNNRYRYIAYRQLIRFVWGFLGKNIRMILPACAVLAIRKKFPSKDGNYTGYLEPKTP